jgi:hypothetical protein
MVPSLTMGGYVAELNFPDNIYLPLWGQIALDQADIVKLTSFFKFLDSPWDEIYPSPLFL